MFPSGDGSMIGAIEFEELVERGYIKQLNDGTGVKSYKITEKFLIMFIKKNEAIEQILDIYPKFSIGRDGNRYPLTTADEDDLKDLYAKKIKESAVEHLEVMKDLQYGIENNLITMGVLKFISSKHWLALRELRVSNEGIDNVSHRKML